MGDTDALLSLEDELQTFKVVQSSYNLTCLLTFVDIQHSLTRIVLSTGDQKRFQAAAPGTGIQGHGTLKGELFVYSPWC